MCKKCGIYQKCKCCAEGVAQGVKNVIQIGGKNTGNSIPGLSAYQIAINKKLFSGTEEEFIEWLKGPSGKSAYQIAVEKGLYNGDEIGFINWLKGVTGKSSYQSAIDTGIFVGTEAQFVNWLKGKAGEDGKSSYRIAVDLGMFSGTEAEFINWLKGVDGKSNYQLALDNGFVGTEQQYLNSLKGTNGKSNYQLAVELQGFVGTEAEYLQSLKGPKGDNLILGNLTPEEKLEITGPPGDSVQGNPGANGWTPLYANIVDTSVTPTRVVLKLIDYFGGTGDKPTVLENQYVGPNGYTTNIADAVNIKGPAGDIGEIDVTSFALQTEVETKLDATEKVYDGTFDIDLMQGVSITSGKISAKTGASATSSISSKTGFIKVTPGDKIRGTLRFGTMGTTVYEGTGIAGYSSNSDSSYVSAKVNPTDPVSIGNIMSIERWNFNNPNNQYPTIWGNNITIIDFEAIIPNSVNWIKASSVAGEGVPIQLWLVKDKGTIKEAVNYQSQELNNKLTSKGSSIPIKGFRAFNTKVEYDAAEVSGLIENGYIYAILEEDAS